MSKLDPMIKKHKILVTGGTRGIGLAIANAFAQKGHYVYITGRNKPITTLNDNIEFLQVDFNDSTDLNIFLDSLSKKELDIVVNNAGINKISAFEKIPEKDFDEIIQFNLKIPFLISQKVTPYMKKNKFGRILNISSIFGHISKEYRASYSSSKFGLVGMTKAMAIEYASDNILCNCLSPGFIDTELTRTVLSKEGIEELTAQVPMKRLGTPEEIAEVALFLTSDSNTFLTGQNIIVDGGFTCV